MSVYLLRQKKKTAKSEPRLNWLFSPLSTLLDKADDITGPIKCMVTESTVHITWQEPVAPNGMIILYEVNYKRLGDTEVKNAHTRTHPDIQAPSAHTSVRP